MDDEIVEGAGVVIRKHRIKKKLTVEELAERAGIDKRLIVEYESNKSGLSVRHLKRLAVAFEISPVWLSYECMVEVNPGIEETEIGQGLKSMSIKYRKPLKAGLNGSVSGKDTKNAAVPSKRTKRIAVQ